MSDPGALWARSASAGAGIRQAPHARRCSHQPVAPWQSPAPRRSTSVPAEAQARAQGADPAQLALQSRTGQGAGRVGGSCRSPSAGDRHRADRPLALGENILHKPADMQALHDQIARLSGAEPSAACGCEAVAWRQAARELHQQRHAHHARAHAGADCAHCALAGEDALTSVGGYQARRGGNASVHAGGGRP